MTARLASVSKCLELYWVWDLSAVIHRQSRSCNLWIGLGWKDLDTPDSTAFHREGFQQLSRYLSWNRGWWQSVTAGRAPALLPLCHCRCSRLEQHPAWPTLQGSTHPISSGTKTLLLLSPCCYQLAVISLLSLCLVPKPEPNSLVNLCRCPPWKLALSPKGLVPSHEGSLLSPSPCKMSQVIPLTDVVLKNPGWVWLWEKDKSFLCCRCCLAVVSSFIRVLSLFLLKRTLVLLI